MHDLAATDQQLTALKNILALQFSMPYDPSYRYTIEAVGAPDGGTFHDIQTALRTNKNYILFSAVNGTRKHVIEQITEHNKFPAGEFCARTPLVAIQFLRGARLPVRVGDEGSICILLDRNPTEASSPSVVKLGGGELAGRQRSYYKSSSSVELIAVVRVKVTSVRSMTQDVTAKVLKRKHKRKREDATGFADEVSEKVKRQMRRIQRKRMDNFGIKEDY